MLNFILVVTLLADSVFFSLASTVGYSYEGSQSSPIFVLYHLFLSTSMIIVYLKEVIRKSTIQMSEITFLAIPFLLLILSSFNVIIYGYIPDAFSRGISFVLLWSTTGICVGLYIARTNSIQNLFKYFDLIMLVITTGIIFSIIFPFLNGFRFQTLGGSTYQAASYYSGFALGINMYFMFFEQPLNNLSIFKSSIFLKLLRISLAPIQIMGILLSGGRGGFILFLAYLLFIAFSSMRNRKRITIFILGTFLFLIIFSSIYPFLSQNTIFEASTLRVFSYITSSGSIDLSQTSGRDSIYIEAVEKILLSPIIGHGIMSSYYIFGNYPHNIFLEILIDGGIIYLLLWICVYAAFFYKLAKLIKSNANNKILWIVLLYPFIMLLFSGTFMSDVLFWFSISYTFVRYEYQKVEKSKKYKKSLASEYSSYKC